MGAVQCQDGPFGEIELGGHCDINGATAALHAGQGMGSVHQWVHAVCQVAQMVVFNTVTPVDEHSSAGCTHRNGSRMSASARLIGIWQGNWQGNWLDSWAGCHCWLTKHAVGMCGVDEWKK